MVFILFTLFKILHGHYFDITYNIFRILWFFVILIGVTLFIYQVTDRIIVYYQRNTNVDVAVKYVPSVEFPSVTICNQNQFRYRILLCLNCDKGNLSVLTENFRIRGVHCLTACSKTDALPNELYRLGLHEAISQGQQICCVNLIQLWWQDGTKPVKVNEVETSNFCGMLVGGT